MRFFKTAAIFAVAAVAAASPLAVRGPGYSTDVAAPGGDAPDSGKNECGVTKDQIAALQPLLEAAHLDETVDGVKQLAKLLLGGVGGVLTGPVKGILGGVTGLVSNVLGIDIKLDGTVDAVANLVDTQVPCLLDTIVRK
ncbi:hypothetical protein H4R20_006513 [Coemansia guatemalensis]|uniref:Uncharacterized protein n=1 Tax=Coemansia guatemalensis TaxID=2761395 RepID=A0A9W8HVR5_9FUNG|nr:hypothetical protein H4R20_006513 [Coemansia guatemalensis]